jgi:glycosyltransferase involved in cell wall biosynthesis
MTTPRLTVIVPVFNEEHTIGAVLGRLVKADLQGPQIIVVDDGSTDATPSVLVEWSERPGFLVLRQERNRGKGAAVRLGLKFASGEVTVIQDGDLEYDPNDLPALVAPILRGVHQAIYGSRRLSGSPGRPWYSRYRVAVGLLNLMCRVLYRQRLTDQATCYKVLPTATWRALELRANRFELCAEVTAKLGRLRIPIHEVAISYKPRTVAQGKKIRLRDAIAAAFTLVRWRWWNIRSLAAQTQAGVSELGPRGDTGDSAFPTCFEANSCETSVSPEERPLSHSASM